MSDADQSRPTEDDLERQREDDPDAPGLGALDDDETPPEPNEPG